MNIREIRRDDAFANTRAGCDKEGVHRPDRGIVPMVAAVRGFQGTGRLWGAPPSMPADRVIATLKHMTGHGQPESRRDRWRTCSRS